MSHPRLAAPLLGGMLVLVAGAAPTGAMDQADQALAASMTAMQQQMAAVPMTGDTDRDFMAMMEPHHASAIDMARVELRDGKSPQLRGMARSIIDDQQREIGEMKAWQASHPNG